MEKKDILASFVEAFCEKKGLTVAEHGSGRVLRTPGLTIMQAVDMENEPGVHVFALHEDGTEPGRVEFCAALAHLCAQLATQHGMEHANALLECYTSLGVAFHVVSIAHVGDGSGVIRVETVGGVGVKEA